MNITRKVNVYIPRTRDGIEYMYEGDYHVISEFYSFKDTRESYLIGLN